MRSRPSFIKAISLVFSCMFLGGFISLHLTGPATQASAQTLAERMGERAKAVEMKIEAVQENTKRLEVDVSALNLRLVAQESHSNQVTGMGIALGGVVVFMQFLQMFGFRQKKNGDAG